MSTRASGSSLPFRISAPLETALKRRLARLGDDWDIPALAPAIGDLDQPDRRAAAYLAAGSFCGFLIDDVLAGDMRRFLQIYRTGAYRQVTGQDLPALEARWRAARLA